MVQCQGCGRLVLSRAQAAERIRDCVQLLYAFFGEHLEIENDDVPPIDELDEIANELQCAMCGENTEREAR